ncbi:MAG TPA: extracellular solute-binding protein [Steroidobacteraceae bacterium]|nr:extracellular solute-binding protein [Steroidobacteraceae bacterium]
MRLTLTCALCLAAGAFAACSERSASLEAARAAGTHTEPEVLYFSNWDGEIGPNTLQDFERRTGIRVVVEDIADNVSLQTKLLAGHSGSDVVVPGSNFLQPLIAAGALQKLDRLRLPNWRHLDPQVLQWIARIDPGNQYGVPYVWGTQAFAYDVQAVTKALGRKPEPSWRLLFDPENARRLSSCGIAWQDSAGSIMVDLALLAIGRDPGRESAADLHAAESALMRVRPYVRYVDSSSRARSDLASGEICAAIGASGDLIQARELAAETGTGIDVHYVLPEEGALLWVDLLVIPTNAPHPHAAHRFIDFLLEPAVIAGVTNASKYANANRDADPFVDPAVRADPGIYPAADVRPRLRLVPAESHEYARQRTRTWARIRAMEREN